MSLPDDGSYDDEIHCFKRSQPCFSGRELLKSQLSILTEPDENPFSKSLDSEDVDAAALEFTLLDDDTEDDEGILID